MHIWLIGAGTMARDYIKVLNALDAETTVIGRGEKSARAFTGNTGHPVTAGGLTDFLAGAPQLPDAAIVAVGVEQLEPITTELIDAGVDYILVEKPAAIDAQGIRRLSDHAEKHGAQVVLGYNRRFYASVVEARKRIEADGGPTSFNFEFTEWSHVIGKLDKPSEVLANWFMANSTHVVDMAFYMGGWPGEAACFRAGSLDWHPCGASFSGAGTTIEGVPFSYQADWSAPGRWGVEVLTAKHRYIFRPLEKLQVQEVGSIDVRFADIDDRLDQEYKPGLYLQVKNFMDGNLTEFCTLAMQADMAELYDLMGGPGGAQ